LTPSHTLKNDHERPKYSHLLRRPLESAHFHRAVLRAGLTGIPVPRNNEDFDELDLGVHVGRWGTGLRAAVDGQISPLALADAVDAPCDVTGRELIGRPNPFR
jgi:hypothetical protein